MSNTFVSLTAVNGELYVNNQEGVGVTCDQCATWAQ